ncbi:MAG: serine/threonine protein kinase, partial [bacterium]|nr:serine/threonine protein kinase [bacterium]
FKVRHRGLGVDRVVKVIRPEHEGDEALRARFKDEARAAAQLTHPNVVRIHDLSTDGENRLIEMEHIDGVDLCQLVRPGRLPSLPVVLEIAWQCLRALGYLHKNGFVHRDVSPDNFMLTLDGDAQPLVKLIDLGIAKHPGGKGTNVFLGKLRYASPEHFGSPERIEQRSDVYAFGIVFYELLTGRHPLCDDTVELAEAVNAHLTKAPRSFDATDPHGRVPEKLRRIVLSALGKSPEERPESADVFGDAIAQLQTTYPLTEDNRQEVRRLLAAFRPVPVGSDDETRTFPGPPPAGPARKTDTLPARRSPFIPGPPIERDEDFFGRRAQRELLRTAVEAGQSVQILGERRMGKTSLLHWVKRHAPDWLDEPR